jgi:Lon protease-like protein
MLADCLAGDRRFGLIYKPEGTAERALPSGHVGCVAVVEDHELLPDGRSNIVVRGESRFALERFAEAETMYHVGEVAPFEDERESALAADLEADEVRALFARVVRAVRRLGEHDGPDPALPDESAALGFLVAAMLDIEADARQRLLASRSVLGRLGDLRRLLANAAERLEVRAALEEGGGGWSPDGSRGGEPA